MADALDHGAVSRALDQAIALLAKAQERQDILATTPRADAADVLTACQNRDVFLADVVRLGRQYLRYMADLDPEAVIDFGDDD